VDGPAPAAIEGKVFSTAEPAPPSELIGFLNAVDKMPLEASSSLILDNYAAHRRTKVPLSFAGASGELQRVRLSAVYTACGFCFPLSPLSGVVAPLYEDRLELAWCVERRPGWLVLRAVLPGGHRLCPIPAD
jgi:hypothetical protein